jgi:hypothetical protein
MQYEPSMEAAHMCSSQGFLNVSPEAPMPLDHYYDQSLGHGALPITPQMWERDYEETAQGIS